MRQINKFDLQGVVLVSQLKADDKALLIELINRTDYEKHGHWDCWPSVERLCQVRGVKHEKNFKGVEHYLPGLVTVRKQGRKNVYSLNIKAIMNLPAFGVTIKHTPIPDTPAVEGVNTPAVADNTPAVAENTPSVAGANSTSNTTRDTTEDSTDESAGAATSPIDKNKINKDYLRSSLMGRTTGEPAVAYGETVHRDTPSRAGVLELPPVVPEEKPRCAKCDTLLIKGLCWECGA